MPVSNVVAELYVFPSSLFFVPLPADPLECRDESLCRSFRCEFIEVLFEWLEFRHR
jgi:hypothetical protein